jgi:hypothetical protein
VIVQATELGAALPTTLVVPLDVVADPYIDRELLVHVPADEAGSRKDHIAIPPISDSSEATASNRDV